MWTNFWNESIYILKQNSLVPLLLSQIGIPKMPSLLILVIMLFVEGNKLCKLENFNEQLTKCCYKYWLQKRSDNKEQGTGKVYCGGHPKRFCL